MWQELHREILEQVRAYYRQRHLPGIFVPGTSKVPYAGRVFDEEELVAGVSAVQEIVPQSEDEVEFGLESLADDT